MFWLTMKHAKKAHTASAATGSASPRQNRSGGSRKRTNHEPAHLDVHNPCADRKSPRLSPRGAPSGEPDLNISPNSDLNLPTAITDVPLELCHTFTTRTKFDAGPSRPVHAAYKTNGDLVVSDVQNQKVKVFDPMGQLKVECTMPRSYAGGMVEPVSVATLRNGEILVCDRHAGNVKLFTADGRCLGLLSSHLMRPVGVAVTSQMMIVVADEARKDVFLFRSMSDRKPASLGKLNAGVITFQQPLHVCVAADDVITVHDAAARKIVMFDKMGKLCSHGLLNTDDFLQDPTRSVTREFAWTESLDMLGLCSTQNNGMLVSHCMSNKIIRYDFSQRTVNRDLLDQNNNCVRRPIAVAASIAGFMAVLEEGQETVKIFNYME